MRHLTRQQKRAIVLATKPSIPVVRFAQILLRKSIRPKGADKYPRQLRHLRRSQTDLDGEVNAVGYTLGC
jgi:hypothetical protein